MCNSLDKWTENSGVSLNCLTTTMELNWFNIEFMS